MTRLQRYSEPYSPTGGLAAEGVVNQLGRPDIEPLEVLLREAVQNSWDAKRASEPAIRVEIGLTQLDHAQLDAVRHRLLVDPPPGLPLSEELSPGMRILHFADYGTSGLGGPTRADSPGADRDFVDFVRNIGQPPDNDLGGGSFGYGKAAFYLASRARTIVIDTLCSVPGGGLERRFIACALGETFVEGDRPHTGRHWWGRLVAGVPEPLTGEAAADAARLLGLPSRDTPGDRGTTIAVVAPGTLVSDDTGTDTTMEFIAEALAWNFWPRMTDTPGGTRRTMEFRLSDGDRRVRLPSPRLHPRLRGFVEAMDRLREEPSGEDSFTVDRSIECFRPIQRLGRLVIQRGAVAPPGPLVGALPQGARLMSDSVHHVALMRNVELVVKYLPGPAPLLGRTGYSGVFRCALNVDGAFRRAEPPTHDDWVFRAVPAGHDRTYVKVALERIAEVCREVAGYQSTAGTTPSGDGIALGEFADSLAVLLPGVDGPGARRQVRTQRTPGRRSRPAPGRSVADEVTAGVWVDGGTQPDPASPDGGSDGAGAGTGGQEVSRRPQPRPPQIRTAGDPFPSIAADGVPVIRYPFELRGFGSTVRLRGTVEVMTNDGAQVETEVPAGIAPPAIQAWIDPSGAEHVGAEFSVGAEASDGLWHVDVPISDEALMRVDIAPEIA